MTRITRILITVAVSTGATLVLSVSPAAAEAKNPFAGACDGGFASRMLYAFDQELLNDMQYWDDECSLEEVREYNN